MGDAFCFFGVMLFVIRCFFGVLFVIRCYCVCGYIHHGSERFEKMGSLDRSLNNHRAWTPVHH